MVPYQRMERHNVVLVMVVPYQRMESHNVVLVMVIPYQLDLLRDWPKLALDRELWREVASRC